MGGKIKGLDFQIKQHKRFLLLRNLNRVIQSDIFRTAWDIASEERRNLALDLIIDLEVRLLQLWVYGDFDGYTARELRQVASANHVPNYCKMDTAELIHYFLQKGIKDGSTRHIRRNETNTVGLGSARKSDSSTYWKAKNRNTRHGF